VSIQLMRASWTIRLMEIGVQMVEHLLQATVLEQSHSTHVKIRNTNMRQQEFTSFSLLTFAINIKQTTRSKRSKLDLWFVTTTWCPTKFNPKNPSLSCLK